MHARCTCARSTRSTARRRCRRTASSATQTVEGLEGAETIARGEKLFVDLGCHGCHLVGRLRGPLEGRRHLDDRAVAAADRGAKADHAWLVRWITNPHEFRPRTRMPNFLFTQTGTRTSRSRSRRTCSTRRRSRASEWLDGERGRHGVAADDAHAQRGRELMDQHRLPRLPRARAGRGRGPARRRQGHRAEPLADRREDRRALDLPLDQEPARLLRRRAHAEPAALRRRGAGDHRRTS